MTLAGLDLAYADTMVKPTIRDATHEDLNDLLALYRHLHPDDPEIDQVSAKRILSAMIHSGSVFPIILEQAGSIVSSCTLAIIPNLSRGGKPYGVIENVVTHTSHRRSGLG